MYRSINDSRPQQNVSCFITPTPAVECHDHNIPNIISRHFHDDDQESWFLSSNSTTEEVGSLLPYFPFLLRDDLLLPRTPPLKLHIRRRNTNPRDQEAQGEAVVEQDESCPVLLKRAPSTKKMSSEVTVRNDTKAEKTLDHANVG